MRTKRRLLLMISVGLFLTASAWAQSSATRAQSDRREQKDVDVLRGVRIAQRDGVKLMEPAMGQEQPVVLRVTTILDGKGQVIQNTIIVVEGGKIARIGGTTPPGAITYDLAGLTVTPGWIDTHDHILWHFHNGRASSVGTERLPPMKGVAGEGE